MICEHPSTSLLLLLLCLPTGADLSAFALLEHADEDGYVENIDNVRELVGSAKPAKPAKSAKAKQQAGKGGSKTAASNSKASTGAGASRATGNQQNESGKQARAEDYYRAFEHVYKDTTGVAWGQLC
jgi:hypothetical protein